MSSGEVERYVPGRNGLHARVVILTVIPEELEAVLEQGDFAGKFIDGTAYQYRNDRGNGVYDLVVANIGSATNVVCSNYVRDLAETLRPEFLILCGIAGGISGRWGAELGNVIVANHVEGYEQQKKTEGGKVRSRVPKDQPSCCLMKHIVPRVKLAGKWKENIKVDRPTGGGDVGLTIGNIISGEKLLGDGKDDYQKTVLNDFNNAMAVDMESYGLARTAYDLRATRHYNFHYLIIRSVSDHVEGANDDEEEGEDKSGNQETRDQWRPYSASAAAAFAIAVADEILAVTDSDIKERTK